MLRAALALLIMLFVLSHGGLAGTAEHDHREQHVHQDRAAHDHGHDHDDGTGEHDQGDDVAVHLHLVADRAPSGHVVNPPMMPRRSTLAPSLQRALLSIATSPPLEPPQQA